ncbi:MAG: DUF4340 domain-containing protein [Bacteroidetes bacterium]|nr:DUF4340 domain-containing protein [Bacteroidota bacterium]
MKKSRKLFSAIAVLLILGAVLIYLKSGRYEEASGPANFDQGVSTEKPGEEINTTEERGPKSLIKMNPSEVDSIEFSTQAEKIIFNNEGESWTVNNGLYNRIDTQRISSVIRSVLNLSSMETVSFTSENREQWGISSQSNRVYINAGDKVTTILLGSLNPSESGYYIQIDGVEEIYIVRGLVGESLSLTIDDLRNRTLPVIDSTQISTITILNDSLIKVVPYQRMDMFSANFYHFMLESPYTVPVPVNKESLTELLESLEKPLEIVDFIDSGNPEDYGIDDSSKKLLIVERSGNSFELLIGKDFDRNMVYGKMKNEDQIFTLNKKDLPFLRTSPFDLMDRFACLIKIDSIDAFSIAEDNYKVFGKIERSGESTLYLLNGIEVGEEKFKLLYQDLLSIFIEGEVSGEVVMNDPAITISFEMNNAEPSLSRIQFYPYNKEFYAVSRNENEAMFIIGQYQLENMMEKIKKTVL